MLLDFSLFDFDPKSQKFLLAVSGGIDSMVLANGFEEASLNYEIAHANYALRGEDSKKDADLVGRWGKEKQRVTHISQFDVAAYRSKYNASVQMAAREMRYAWFEQLLVERELDYVVTAHHLEDLLETQLINLSRGTGLVGFTSLQPQSHNRIRPMLYVTKPEIEAYAAAKILPWRADESNASEVYLRNRIRHQILPKLEKLHPAFWENIRQSAQHLQAESQMLKNHLNELRSHWQEEEPDCFCISIEHLTNLKPISAYLHHLFYPFGFSAAREIEKLFSSASGSYRESDTHRITVYGNQLFLMPLTLLHVEPFQLEELSSNSFRVIGEGHLQGRSFLLDSERIAFPLAIRPPDSSDVFYPQGMKGSKSLRKYMRDERLNPIERQRLRILSDQKNAVICVLNRRFDRRYLANDTTRKTIEICFE